MVSTLKIDSSYGRSELTRWKTCSLLTSFKRAFKSFTLVAMSSSFPLSVLSISLVSPMTKSSISLIPPFSLALLVHPLRPEVELGVKQILWLPASADENVKRPDEEPFWETTRWSLSKISYYNVSSGAFQASLAEAGIGRPTSTEM